MPSTRFSLIAVVALLALTAAGCEQRSNSPSAANSPGAAPNAANAPANPPSTNAGADSAANANARADAQPGDRATLKGQATALTDGDRAFVTQAAAAGMAEVEAGKVAANKTTDPQVKAFAQDLVKDHTKANDQLMKIAAAKGVPVPAEPHNEARQRVNNLRGLSGQLLVRTFVNDFGIDAHKKAIELFERQAREGADPELKAFAEKTLPALREHLAMAEGLASKVN
jgi:putative membrane protein